MILLFISVDPSSMQDACHIWTQLNDLALHEFLYLLPPGFREVMGSIPVGDA